MFRHRFLWLVCISLLSIPLSLSAQTSTGAVRGYVKDQNGAPITDAEVKARNPATGVLRSATSRADGAYVLTGLPPASYEVSARHIGFNPQRRQLAVSIGATMTSDFTLQEGAVEL